MVLKTKEDGEMKELGLKRIRYCEAAPNTSNMVDRGELTSDEAGGPAEVLTCGVAAELAELMPVEGAIGGAEPTSVVVDAAIIGLPSRLSSFGKLIGLTVSGESLVVSRPPLLKTTWFALGKLLL